jgi:hypothetical protein
LKGEGEEEKVKREWREVRNVTEEELPELEAPPAGATLSH